MRAAPIADAPPPLPDEVLARLERLPKKPDPVELAGRVVTLRPLEPIEHAFTHFDLVVAPLLASCRGPAGVMDSVDTVWYNPREPAAIGLPAPIKTLLERIASPLFMRCGQG